MSSGKVALKSVIISEKKRNEIEAAISQLANTNLIFKEWGFEEVFEKGTAVSLLFWGIPGTGKTLTAQAIADSLGAELKVVGTAELQSSEPGGMERTMREVFRVANSRNMSSYEQKQVILFDECDSLLMDRNDVGPILGAQVNALLSEIEHYNGVIIFTTNRLGKLDPALERRITAKIEFEFPDKEARLAIWKRMIPEKAPLAQDVDFGKLSEYPLAGGNIKNAVLNAARAAAHAPLKPVVEMMTDPNALPTSTPRKEIEMIHFVDAIEREAASLQAFIGEYEKSLHPQMMGFKPAQSNLGMSQSAQMKMEHKIVRFDPKTEMKEEVVHEEK